MATKPAWPNGKKIAVSVTVMFETWSEGAAPNYSVQTTHLKSGTVDHASKAWSTYGGRVGVWRLIRMPELDMPPARSKSQASGSDSGVDGFSIDRRAKRFTSSLAIPTVVLSI